MSNMGSNHDTRLTKEDAVEMLVSIARFDISAADVDRLFGRHWRKVSFLAHTIRSHVEREENAARQHEFSEKLRAAPSGTE